MRYVYKFEHKRVIEIDRETGEKIYDTKLLGFFRSRKACKDLILVYLKQPGFKDYPDDFIITRKEADVNDYNDKPGEFGLSVFYLCHEWYDGEYDILSDLGVYSTEELAKKAQSEYMKDPDLVDHPDGFGIDEYTIGERQWTEGFFTY